MLKDNSIECSKSKIQVIKHKQYISSISTCGLRMYYG